MSAISCIILAGGESKRFGEDKAFFNFNGKSFLERALDAASEISGDIVICVRGEDKIKGCFAEAEKVAKKRAEAGKPNLIPKIIADDKDCGFKGPLKGIYSSIKILKGELTLVMECDAPFFNFYAAAELIRKLESEKVDAVVPLWPDSTVEPLLACYKTKKTAGILEILNNYALNLKEHFLFTDSVNISRLLPSVYYYNIFDMAKNNSDLKAELFININSKKDLEKYGRNEKIFNKGGSKSVKIRKANRFFDLKNPADKPYGILANALYCWWVYAKTGNFIYFRKAFGYFKKDAFTYRVNGLNFMGDKIINLLPDPLGIVRAKNK
jgi:molybdopterin-guanine dinucleotide biosynthesis protein A